MELERIGVLSLAKLQAAFMAIIGFVFAVVYLVFAISFLDINTLGIFQIAILLIFYVVFGFITGAIFAFIYNLVSKRVGGVRLKFKK